MMLHKRLQHHQSLDAALSSLCTESEEVRILRKAPNIHRSGLQDDPEMETGQRTYDSPAFVQTSAPILVYVFQNDRVLKHIDETHLRHSPKRKALPLHMHVCCCCVHPESPTYASLHPVRNTAGHVQPGSARVQEDRFFRSGGLLS